MGLAAWGSLLIYDAPKFRTVCLVIFQPFSEAIFRRKKSSQKCEYFTILSVTYMIFTIEFKFVFRLWSFLDSSRISKNY
jgi:hypothetical protein